MALAIVFQVGQSVEIFMSWEWKSKMINHVWAVWVQCDVMMEILINMHGKWLYIRISNIGKETLLESFNSEASVRVTNGIMGVYCEHK